jgi:hypothetical protein
LERCGTFGHSNAAELFQTGLGHRISTGNEIDKKDLSNKC